MDFLKKLYPLSFRKSAEVSDLVKRIIIYVVIAILAGVIISLIGLAGIGWLNALLGIVSTVVDIYCTGGVVVAILVHCNVIKTDSGEN